MRYIAERQIIMNSYFVMAATVQKKLPLRISSGTTQKSGDQNQLQNTNLAVCD